jgi:hypothetical protein
MLHQHMSECPGDKTNKKGRSTLEENDLKCLPFKIEATKPEGKQR